MKRFSASLAMARSRAPHAFSVLEALAALACLLILTLLVSGIWRGNATNANHRQVWNDFWKSGSESAATK